MMEANTMSDGLQIGQIQQNFQPQGVDEKRNTQAAPTSGQDDQTTNTQALQLSPQGQDLRTALQALKSVPDVRQQKISQLQQQLAQGQLNVVPEITVQKVLDKIFPPTA